jgi:recombinational DNA repair protein RecR
MTKELTKIHEHMLKIEKLIKVISNLDDATIGGSVEHLKICPIKHSFADNMYIREIFMPKDTFIISKLHKKTHPYFVLKGRVSVNIDGEVKEITAPYSGITEKGTQRVLYIHEDTVWITVHSTKETELNKIEDDIISKTYQEYIEYKENLLWHG